MVMKDAQEAKVQESEEVRPIPLASHRQPSSLLVGAGCNASSLHPQEALLHRQNWALGKVWIETDDLTTESP